MIDLSLDLLRLIPTEHAIESRRKFEEVFAEDKIERVLIEKPEVWMLEEDADAVLKKILPPPPELEILLESITSTPVLN